VAVGGAGGRGALAEGLRRLGLDLDPEREELLARYRDGLIAAEVNVSGLRERTDVEVKHLVDSLTCLKVLSLRTGDRLLDIGSGAGLPGIPLAIAVPGLEVTLLEASARKSGFLRRTLGELGLPNVRVVTARAEDYGRGVARESYHAVVARAVGPLAVVAEYGLPLLRVGGWLLAMKGPAVTSELQSGEEAARLLGGGTPRVVEMTLPVLGHRRCLVLVPKVRATDPRYPRRSGVPARRPLGGR